MEKIESLYPFIGTIAVVLGGVWFIVQQAFKMGVMSHRLDEVEKHTSCLPDMKVAISEIKMSLGLIEKTLTTLPCASHSEDLVKVKSIITQKFPSVAKSASLKASPRQLNPIGLQIFNDINGEDFLNANKADLFKYIADHKPLTKLDVEHHAHDAFLPLIETPVFNKIKDYVYEVSSFTLENGEKFAPDVIDICFILSLPLRDMYLKENGAAFEN